MEKSAGGQSGKSVEYSTLSPTQRAKKAKSKSTASSRRDEPHLVRVGYSRKPRLTAEQHKRLAALAALPDDQIDTSDIPERTDYSGPVYIGLFPSSRTKKSVTIRLDDDIVKWFKKQGKGWQTKMNWVLRLYFASHRKTGVKVGRP